MVSGAVSEALLFTECLPSKKAAYRFCVRKLNAVISAKLLIVARFELLKHQRLHQVSKKRCASNAAMQPVPALVIAWR